MIDLKKYFSEAYVINLEKRKDRLEEFKNEATKFKITGFEIFKAIDGKTHNKIEQILPGEIGILLSHYEIIKNAYEKHLENILILEDDVYFTDEILKLDEYMNSVPKDWDFLYFGGNHIYGNTPVKINDKIIKLNYTVALQCVAISNKAFETILTIIPKLKKQVDAYYADLHETHNAYCFTPNMAKQKAGFSDIQNSYVDYSKFFK